MSASKSCRVLRSAGRALVPVVAVSGLLVGLCAPRGRTAEALQATNGGWAFTTTGPSQEIDGTTWYTASERSTTLPSGLVVSIAVTGSGAGMADTGGEALSVRGGASGHFVSDDLLAALGAKLVTTDAGCAYGTLCANRGTFQVSFSSPVTDPVISFSGIGGFNWFDASSTVSWTELVLTTPGVTLTKLSGKNLTVSGTRIEPTDKNPTLNCSIDSDAGAGSTASAVCGSVKVNGTVSSVSFTADLGSACHGTCYTGPNKTEDVWAMVVSVGEDFGSAPVSYDTAPSSHVVGSLRMGATVTADQTGTLDPSSNVDAVAAGADITTKDDGTAAFSGTPVFRKGSNFSATVALAGVSSPATLCGWIDFNANGTFDPEERACASPGAGATSARLVWPVPTDISASAKYARLRLSFAAGADSPVGKLPSGEVEDYSFAPVISEGGLPPTGADPFALTLSGLFLLLSGLVLLRGRIAGRRENLAR